MSKFAILYFEGLPVKFLVTYVGHRQRILLTILECSINNKVDLKTAYSGWNDKELDLHAQKR